MALTLFNGRPEDCSGREEKEIRVYDLLDSLKIPYQRTDHGGRTDRGGGNAETDL